MGLSDTLQGVLLGVGEVIVFTGHRLIMLWEIPAKQIPSLTTQVNGSARQDPSKASRTNEQLRQQLG